MYPKPTSLSTCLTSSTIQSKIKQLWRISTLGALYFTIGMSLGRYPEHLQRQRYFSEWSESISQSGLKVFLLVRKQVGAVAALALDPV